MEFKVGDEVVYEGEIFVLEGSSQSKFPLATDRPTKRHGVVTTFTLEGNRTWYTDTDKIRHLTKLERALK